MSENKISNLPIEIKQLTKLKYLDLSKNPIPITPEILQEKPQKIFDFYFTSQHR